MKNVCLVFTVFLVMSVSTNLFAQSPESSISPAENSGSMVQSDLTVDPLPPASLVSVVKIVPDSSGYVMTTDGRLIQVDGQGVQSLAVPEKTGRREKKKGDELHRNSQK